jgi:protein-L-isoaspartate(D-aspartate) O-methyltransferase
MDLALRRRFYAEEIAATADIRTAAVVEALAVVPRERFVGDGPWTIRGEADFQAAPRLTPDAEPRHVYHNLSVAIDAERQLFNGAPGLLAMAIDGLGLEAGHRVLHLGAGTGYYTAIIAECVGPGGQVHAVEVDPALAAAARRNLADWPWVNVACGDGREPLDARVDAILVNAGVTHPRDAWLDALGGSGRMMLPVTVAMTPSIGKGLLIRLAATGERHRLDARVAGYVAIYNAIGVRDPEVNAQLADAFRTSPMPRLTGFRRDDHAASAACWLHRRGGCWRID